MFGKLAHDIEFRQKAAEIVKAEYHKIKPGGALGVVAQMEDMETGQIVRFYWSPDLVKEPIVVRPERVSSFADLGSGQGRMVTRGADFLALAVMVLGDPKPDDEPFLPMLRDVCDYFVASPNLIVKDVEISFVDSGDGQTDLKIEEADDATG